MRYILLAAYFVGASNIAYGMEIKDLTDLFNQKDPVVVFEGTRYTLDGPYCKTKPLANNSPSVYTVTLQQTNGWLRNKKIVASRKSVTGQFKQPKIKKRSYTYTTVTHVLTAATLFGAGALITYMLMQDE